MRRHFFQDPSAHALQHGRQHAPDRQLDQGTFEVASRLRSNNTFTPVGYVHVVTGGTNVLVEHWVLGPGYDSPDSTQDMDVKKVDDYASLSAFLDDMRDKDSEEGPFKYVVAECTYYEALPEP